jgi:hypothetical protein
MDFENRIIALEKCSNEIQNRINTMLELQELTHRRLDNLEKETRLAGKLFDELGIDVRKFYEVYYKIFPERVEQDVRFAEQMNAIKGGSASKDSPRKP